MRMARATVLALLAACGPTVDRRLFEAFRDTCDGLVPSGATVEDAAQRFGRGADVSTCPPPPLQPLPGGDQCDYQGTVCRIFWWSYSRDQSLCGVGGCYYWCEVRAPGPVLPPPVDAAVCGSWFVSGQPCPPYAC
ncbi:MAG TPA: hypothetical protein VFR85_15160 [Anaeromyxobacteraceae bacterium]|nr:hypothetical protein [Anaeromyxobacteraceae bacterium]